MNEKIINIIQSRKMSRSDLNKLQIDVETKRRKGMQEIFNEIILRRK